MTEFPSDLRVALVQDIMASYGGSEQVLLRFHEMFPRAPIFTAVHDPARLPRRFAHLDVRTSFLQHVPLSRRRYELIVPLMPAAFTAFDLSGYDLVISNSHACSHGVQVRSGAVHFGYVHTPMRYAWTHEDVYLAKAPLRPLSVPIGRFILTRMRHWDAGSAQRLDAIACNSTNVQDRIRRFWHRDAEVVPPPIDLERFQPTRRPPAPDAPFLVVGRLVEYKRTEVVVEACTRLGLPLRVIGRGPELRRLKRIAGPNVRFEGEVSDSDLEYAYRTCRALIFPADEDFGLTPIEAMASGRPVLALGRGGALETVVAGDTGEFYPDAGVDALVEALKAFEPAAYDPAVCRRRAEEFAPSRFRARISELLSDALMTPRPGRLISGSVIPFS